MSVFKYCRISIVIGLGALLLSCDVAGGLFSQSELADMYEVWIDIDGFILGDGDLVRSDSFLVPVIESHSSVSGPEKLSLVLVDMNGTEAARLTFMAESGTYLDMEDTSLRTVDSMNGPLPSFSIPADLAEGYYHLETQLYDSNGRVLSNASTLVLVYDGVIPAPQIETFPSSPAKGQRVFLRLVSGLPEEFDPWLRWYIGTGMRKEGYASDFADRLVWQIPESDGFFSVRAEVFPFKPPLELLTPSVSTIKPRLSAFQADLILAVGPAQVYSSFDGIERAYSVDFKSDPEAQMVENADGTTLPLVMIGSPYLESHDYGYGQALQSGSGYLIPGIILPQAVTPFTLDVAFYPADSPGASGALVTFYDPEGTSSFLRLGISGGLPYLEAGDRIVQAFADLPPGLSHLAVEVVPSEADTTEAIVSLFLNNELIGNGFISSSMFTRAEPITILVGGPEGLDAVYDAFAVMNGRFQAFLIAKAQEFGSSLLAASGFEGGSMGRGISAQGPIEVEDGYVELPLDASLEIPVPFEGFTVEIEGYGATPGLLLVMDDGSLLTLHVGRNIVDPLPEPETDSGEWVVLDSLEGMDSGSAGFSFSDGWGTGLNHSLSLSVEAVAGGLRVSDDAGRDERIPTALSGVTLRVQPVLSAPLILRTIMVRTFSSVDSVDRAARVTLLPPAAALD